MSTFDQLLAYRRERFPSLVFLPLAVFIAASGGVWSATLGLRALGPCIVLALALVVQFRLWDDLSDVSRDRVEHPTRTLPSVPSLTPFRIALALASALSVLSLAWVAFLGGRPLLPTFTFYGGLNVFYAVWYGGARKLLASRAVAAHGLLLKYPIFVLLIGGSRASLLSAGFVYLCLCVNELIDDAELRASASPLLRGADMAVLGIVSIVLTLRSVGERVRGVHEAVLIASTFGVLATLFRFYRDCRRLVHPSRSLRRSFFLACFLQILTLSLWSRS